MMAYVFLLKLRNSLVTEPHKISLQCIFKFQDTISVHNPTFYAQRFITFLKSHVFHMTAGNYW